MSRPLFVFKNIGHYVTMVLSSLWSHVKSISIGLGFFIVMGILGVAGFVISLTGRGNLEHFLTNFVADKTDLFLWFVGKEKKA